MAKLTYIRMLPYTLLILIGHFSLASCGYKGPVKPLEKALPGAVQKLHVQQFGEMMRVSWTAPTANQDGSPLTDLDHYEIYRMNYDPLDDCPECRDTSTLLRNVDPGYLEEVQLVDKRFYLSDQQDLFDGRGYQYRLVAVNHKGYGGSTSQVRRPYYLPPTPPAGLNAEGLDRLARLNWQEPATPDGMTLIGYRIYRGEGEAPLAPLPLNSTLVTKTDYDDFGIVNDRSYRYAVRAVFTHGETELETDFSNLARTTPGG